MTGPQDKKDEAVTAPLEAGERKPDPASLDPMLGALRQRYDLLRELGRGGMGIVYQARDRETGDTVALKILQPEIASHPELIERFKSELLLARKITHKNVCRVYDLNRFGSVAAIAMEYVEGESLRKVLERVDGLSVHHALRILRQVMAALAEAHAQGVVHRDLKPENIVLARDGTVKLMDFGIARSLEATATQTSSIIGTPAYMSPEQASAQPIDARSDIYSLGLLMFEMFTGQVVFRAETPAALLHKHVFDTPPPARNIEPDLPERIERVIQKCLEKEPSKRFQSIAELEAAFREEAPPALTPEGEPIPSPNLVKWQRADFVLLALGLIGLVYFLVFRDHVFPASQMRLEVDAISARRAAEELAGRLGNPFAGGTTAETRLGFRPIPYALTAVAWALGEIPPEQSRHWWSEFDTHWPGEPLVWRVTFRNEVAIPGGGRDAGSAIVDRKGKVERLSRYAWIPGGYRPPPIEQRRAQAQQAVESACGPIPPYYALTETSGGEQNASYSATWSAKLGLRSRLPQFFAFQALQASFLAEKLADLRCRREEDWEAKWIMPPGTWEKPLWFFGTLIGIFLVVLFILTRGYRVAWLWRRLPLALLLGVIGEWLVHAALGWPDVPLAVNLLETLAGAGLALIALVTAEDHLRRRVPGRVATYVLAWRGRVAEPAVALAIVRGALAGLALVAFETLLAHLTLLGGDRMRVGPLRFFAFVLVDPWPVAQAVESFSPALYVLSAALFGGVVIAMILLGLVRALHFRKFRQAESSLSTYIGALFVVAVPWWFSGFRMNLGGFLLPPMGGIWAFLLEALLLAWLLERYDVLTVLAAVATAVIWIINYPLLVILREVGNAAHWAIFFAWGLVVLAAAVVAFRSQLGRARRQFATSFQS